VQGPTVLLVFSAFVLTAVFATNVLLTHHIDLGPRERIVDGQLHITLTGWDQPAEDYAVLAAKTATVVLQMANPDVTDSTLDYLQRYQLLEELDLNDTQITDAGLARLSSLPRLRVLRLRGTRITDEGFRTHLLDKNTLQELDVRDTAVASKTLRQWKNDQSEIRRYLK
jgi:Leucine-rich repeat (LRR) protein